MYQRKKTIFELLSSNSNSASKYTESERKNRGQEQEMTPCRVHQMRSAQSPSPYFEKGFAKKIEQKERSNSFYTQQQQFSQNKASQNDFDQYTPQKSIGLRWNQQDREYYQKMANQYDFQSNSPRSKPLRFQNSNTRSRQSFEMQQEQEHFFGRGPEQKRYQEITKQMKQNRYYVPQPSFLTSFHPNQLYSNQKDEQQMDEIPQQRQHFRFNTNYYDQYQDCSAQEMMRRVVEHNRNPFQPVSILYLQNNEGNIMQETYPHWINFKQS